MSLFKKICTDILKRRKLNKALKENDLSKNVAYISNVNITGKNNKIYINENTAKACIKHIALSIEGNNNKVEIGESLNNIGFLVINILGDNNNIKIKNNVKITENLTLQIQQNCKNGSIEIGDNTSFWQAIIQTNDYDSSVNIGSDYMFSHSIMVMNSDGHSIFQNGKLINKAENLTIGNHCWIGYDAVIYKNAQIPDNTIVAKNAFVTGGDRFKGLTNIAIGGIPAKVIKQNVTWNKDSINQSIDKGLL